MTKRTSSFSQISKRPEVTDYKPVDIAARKRAEDAAIREKVKAMMAAKKREKELGGKIDNNQQKPVQAPQL